MWNLRYNFVSEGFLPIFSIWKKKPNKSASPENTTIVTLRSSTKDQTWTTATPILEPYFPSREWDPECWDDGIEAIASSVEESSPCIVLGYHISWEDWEPLYICYIETLCPAVEDQWRFDSQNIKCCICCLHRMINVKIRKNLEYLLWRYWQSWELYCWCRRESIRMIHSFKITLSTVSSSCYIQEPLSMNLG